MAEDTIAMLDHLGVDRATVYGYSMGGGIALELAINHPERVRKAIVASMPFQPDGWYPGVLEATAQIAPDDFVGTGPARCVCGGRPKPGRLAHLVERVKQLDLQFEGSWPTAIRSIAPLQFWS